MRRSQIKPTLSVMVGAAIILVSTYLYAASASQGASQGSPQIDPQQFGQLAYRHIGPQGNRMVGRSAPADLRG